MKSPLSGWIGGKSQLAKRIIARIPEHGCYVEAFAGGAWVLFRKPESEVEVINDLNRDVVTLYRVVQHHLEEFIRYFKWMLVSRDEFDRMKRVEPETLTDVQRAARFFYLQKCCFGGRIVNPSFGTAVTRPPKLNLLRIEEDLSGAHLRLSRAYVECLPYDHVIAKYDRPETFFFVDPPYWGCEDYYGKEMFSRDDFARLREILAGVRGKFLLTLNDVPEVRDIFRDFRIESETLTYTVGKGVKPAKEVFITNY
jgi:DNA adenine methylase